MTIEELAQEFETWRKNRKKLKEPIPPRLWKLSVAVAKENSASVVAQACKIQVAKLKKRMGIKPVEITNKINFQKLPASKHQGHIELVTPSGILVKIFS